jgi:ABC-type Fe3+-hydroxamate transport system substrate-binding protein
VTAPGLVVGATDWCTHPGGLDVRRVRGTKNPDLAAVVALRPDLVLANDEENRAPDVAALRAASVAVWVTAPRTVPAALDSLEAMLAACGLDRPAWLTAAAAAWRLSYDGSLRRAFVPIWRRPWMALGRDTFAGDLLRRLGVASVHADDAERYPRVDLANTRARGVDLVVLPDEPYAFTPQRDLDAFAGWGVPVAFVSGRHLTWYGPSLVDARTVLADQLTHAVDPGAPRNR